MRINWRGFCVIGVAVFLLFNIPLAMAESFSSASFKIKDATFDIYGGLSTSISFRNVSAGGQAVAGTASSGSFKGEVGILYFAAPAVEEDDEEEEPAPAPALGGGALLDPILQAQKREAIVQVQRLQQAIELERKELLARISPVEIIKKVVDFFIPKKEEISIEELVSKRYPLVFRGEWNLLPQKALDKFVLAPLPRGIRVLAQKFPELKQTFEEVGIAKITDVQKLRSVDLLLPGLTERAGVPRVEIRPGKFALPKGVPLADLPLEFKQKLPTDIVFARSGGELIDLKVTLSLSERGKVRQKVFIIAGQTLNLSVKPDRPVKSIKGYLVFKRKISSEARPPIEIAVNQLVASPIFTLPNLAQQVVEPLSVEVEDEFVLLEFEYTDPDGDGIYTADIQVPVVEGEYETITVFEYEDPDVGRRVMRLVTVVDPEGYIYEQDGERQIRIPGAIVSLFWLDSKTNEYGLWPADEFIQENPQVTNVTGKYSFLVPEGTYYVKVEAPGYLVHEGKPFVIKENRGVHTNIELKTRYWWVKRINVTMVLVIVIFIMLLYNFYHDKLRERRKYG